MVGAKQTTPDQEILALGSFNMRAEVCTETVILVVNIDFDIVGPPRFKITDLLLCRLHLSCVCFIQWLPSLLVFMSVIISFVTPEALSYLPFVIFGTYGGWLYLRYLLRNTETNLNGDPKDEFSFSTFFPGFIRYFLFTFLLCLISAVNKGLFFFSFLLYVETKCLMTLKWTSNKNQRVPLFHITS